MQVFLLFLLVFFSFFHLHFFSGDTLPSSSVILMEYYIPLNILILFDAVALRQPVFGNDGKNTYIYTQYRMCRPGTAGLRVRRRSIRQHIVG